ncbi:unnamed protein product (mitochondrion) [Plasmodiophora brassicae]|uniref:hydroxymethylbilane synthase n=2 Tax=Plasmodiophora brassicae TaxID=37360 RepID=A0A3P3YM40_PLABS|nr:unnamed protein product [Plasmodiophora brassicae]
MTGTTTACVDDKQAGGGARPHAIGTRRSPLAMYQARTVQAMLCGAVHPAASEAAYPLLGITSEADANLTQPLHAFATVGVFTAALDRALLSGQVDLAVHSLKDLPTCIAPGLRLAAVLRRTHRHDVLVVGPSLRAANALDEFPDGARIGTSSLRRQATLRRLHGGLTLQDLRGNIGTRLASLSDGRLDAIVMAEAALQRLELSSHHKTLGLPGGYYAPGQGAIAVVVRDADLDLCSAIRDALNDAQTELECAAERALLRTVEGGCRLPVAVRCSYDDEHDVMTVDGQVLSIDGSQCVTASVADRIERSTAQADQLGTRLARILLDGGAQAIIERIKQCQTVQRP